MKQILIILFLLLSIKSFSQDDQPPITVDANMTPTIIQNGDSVVVIYVDGRMLLVRLYNASLGKRDSTLYVTPYFASQNYLPIPSITANSFIYWTGTAFASPNVQYSSSGTGRVAFGWTGSLVDPVAFDSTYSITFYNQHDHSVNGQKFKIGYSNGTNLFQLKATSFGSGAQQPIAISTNGKTLNIIASTPDVTGVFNFDAGTSNTTNGSSLAGVTGTMTGSSSTGRQYGLSSVIDVNQTGGGFTTVFGSAHIIATGTGLPLLLQLQTSTGAANTGTILQKLSVDTACMFRFNNVAGTANQIMGVDNAGKSAEYKTITASGNGLSVTLSGANAIAFSGKLSFAHNITTPTTGATVSLTNNNYNIINPAGTIATLTVNFPSSPSDGDVVKVKFTQIVTTVTYGNGTVVGAKTSPTAGDGYTFVFDSGTSKWY